jgi:hypothetical protein
VVEKYRHIAPRFNFRRACASVLASDLRVKLSTDRQTCWEAQAADCFALVHCAGRCVLRLSSR